MLCLCVVLFFLFTVYFQESLELLFITTSGLSWIIFIIFRMIFQREIIINLIWFVRERSWTNADCKN